MKKKIILFVFVLLLALNSAYGQISGPTIYIGDLLLNTPTYSTTINTAQYRPNGYFYHAFVLSVPMNVAISHCGSTISSSGIYLYDHNGNIIDASSSAGDGGCSNAQLAYLDKKNLQPGTYYVKSQFNSFYEQIKVTITSVRANLPGNTRSNPINLGSKDNPFVYADTKNTNDFSNEYTTRPPNDVYYKFTLEKPMTIEVSHCGSGLSDTYISLLGAGGGLIAYNDDYSGEGACSNTRQAYLKVDNLAIGTYYVVSEGCTGNGSITTRIEGKNSAIVNINTDRNYLLTVIPTTAVPDADRIEINNSLKTVQYFDGLGRPVQTTQINAAPDSDKSDLVSYQEYDSHGRESKAWLPVAVTSNNGAFVSYNNFVGKSLNAYAGDSKAYNLPVYENSPLNRIQEQYGPGQDWQNNGKAVRTAYLSNNSTYPCKLYNSTDDRQTVSITRTSSTANYNNNQLYVVRLADEDENISYEFKNKLGQVVLTRQMEGASSHDTYYIYDSYSNLRAVLPPLATDNLNSGTWGEDNTSLQQYAYLYKYDDRNRMIAKKLPGAEWIYYVYDKADQLIFTQDGEQRLRGEWSFSILDALQRVALNGTCRNSLNYAGNPLANIYVKATWGGSSATYRGYNISGVSLTGPVKLLTANYYDNYDFLALSGYSTLGYTNPESGYGTKKTTDSYTGLLTGTYAAEAGEGSIALQSALYYDYQGRLIQRISTNHLGGKDSEYTAYNFSGQAVKKKTVQTAGMTIYTEYYTYTYDHAGRLLKTEHQQGSNMASKIVLAENTYDGLGRLKTVKKGDLPASTYNYNVRSWVKSITGTLFSQTLYYNESYAGSTPQYNGNISAMSWKAGSETLRGYRFAYDDLSRMTGTDYLVNGSLNDSYKVPTISYDKHGNITALERWGKTSSGYGMVDKLTLGYTGNQLEYVTDIAVKTPDVTLGLNDFKDASSLASGEYGYNRNGAMTKDLNKGISNIQYNSLNLPTQLTINGMVNNYTYSANGTKLRVSHGTDVTDYAGNKVYENGSLKRIFVDGGYIVGGTYHFYIQDHQGNNRVVATGTGTIVQRNHYYPFGMTFGEIAVSEQDKQQYKYNGKELDRKNGLNLYDYSARYMEPSLGRFTTMDPLAEKYYSISPYAYCAGNPIRFVDPTGMFIGNPLIQPFQRRSYQGNILSKAYSFAYNTGAAICNVPINIANQLVDEAQYIGDNGVGAYLESGANAAVGAITSGANYVTDTSISEKAAGLGAAFTNIETWENVAAGAVTMAMPLKGMGTKAPSASQGANVTTRGGSIVNLTEETFSQALAKGAENVRGYSVYGTKGLVGNVYNRNIFLLEASSTKSLSGLRGLINSFEKEALKSGANKISIYGSSVINKGFFNPNIAKRFGYSFEQSGSGVFFQKGLKP